MAIKAKDDFVFKKNMSIGEVDAENDQKFLGDCFIDTGDYDALHDVENPHSIIIGRTGAGKSALLEQIEDKSERVIRLEPEVLSLRYISNSSVLSFFEDLGVNLDVFYNLLWQHTFAVELIRNYYGIDSEAKKESFLSNIYSKIKNDRKKQEALKYIDEWGDKFWLDTEARIKEFTDKLEDSLKQSVTSKIPGINFGFEQKATLSEELKAEVVYYGKKVVSSVQIEKLSKIVSILGEDIFTDNQKKTFIIIDKLDESWVDDDLRYKLIRALIETVKKFRNIRPVKIIFTLRADLLNRVLEKTRDSGFQREKYESFFLYISWNKLQLKELLDKRINHLLKCRYTNGPVTFDDIFPSKIDGISSAEYILERTLLRPRDAIMFVNTCLAEAQGKTEITSTVIQLAEKKYSYDRFESLKDEWSVEHPKIDSYVDILRNKKYNFKASSITKDELEKLVVCLVDEVGGYQDDVVQIANKYFKSKYPDSERYIDELKKQALYTLYKVGIIGIKLDGSSSVKWVYDRTQDLTHHKIHNNSIIYIHRMLWRELAVDKRN